MNCRSFGTAVRPVHKIHSANDLSSQRCTYSFAAKTHFALVLHLVKTIHVARHSTHTEFDTRVQDKREGSQLRVTE